MYAAAWSFNRMDLLFGENIQRILDTEFKELGHENISFTNVYSGKLAAEGEKTT